MYSWILYSALAATCALGERIFNHIILDLSESFKDRESYRKIFSKNSFYDWDGAKEIMCEWDIFLHDDVVLDLKTLAEIRHRSIHFNPDTIQSIRDEALLALNTLSKIISLQFGFADEGNKWLNDGPKGYFLSRKKPKFFLLSNNTIYHNVHWLDINLRWTFQVKANGYSSIFKFMMYSQ